MGRLKRFFSPQVSELVTNKLLQSHLREAAIRYFATCAASTAFSETTEPDDVMAVLREYHQAMGMLIFQHEAISSVLRVTA